MSHTDPSMPLIIGMVLVVILVSIILQKFKQPSIVACIIAGIVLGPDIMGLITDTDILNRMGTFGVIFLLFFVGMEISLPDLVKNWKIIIFGALLQIIISLLCIGILGWWLNWAINQILLLGFVVSLSSTAVVIKMLHEYHEENTFIGQNVIGILLVQDIAVIPMLLSINFLSRQEISLQDILLQVGGGISLLGLLTWLIIKKDISLPFAKLIKADHELQVFTALLLCLGAAYVTSFFGLSAALGAFLAGIIVSKAKEIHWVKINLESFRNLFVAIFFISIGMSVNLQFLFDKFWIVVLLALAVLASKTFVNAIVFKLLGVTDHKPLYVGAVLAQIGEFSFVLASVGLQANIITQYIYQATITIIFLSLLFSYLWIAIIKRWVMKHTIT